MSAVATTLFAPSMPPSVPHPTPDDLFRLPDGGKGFELVDGQLKEVNVSFLSSYIAGEIYSAIRDHIRPRSLGWVVPEGTSFQCFPDDAGRVRRADTAFLHLSRLTATRATSEGHCTVCPDLVVEVISPNDLAYDVNRKVEEWLKAGAGLVWVIDPDAKTIDVHQPRGVAARFREPDTLTGEPILPGFAVGLVELFRLPVAPVAG